MAWSDALAFAALFGVAGCLVDADAPCGGARVLDPSGGCVCPTGRVASSDGHGCTEAPLAAADAGSTITATVTDAGANADAASGPTGLGASCATSADCAAFDATYCETSQGHVCLIPNCTTGPDSCPADWACCDLTPFGMPTLCVPAGSCPL